MAEDGSSATPPPQFDALYRIALIELQRGRLVEAVESFGRALAVDPGRAAAHLDLGIALGRLGRSEQALASFERALALDPDHADAWNNRGAVLIALGRHAEALASFDRSLALRPDSTATLSNRGVALAGLRRYGEALACYERVLALSPDLADAWRNRGNALVGLGRNAEALASYERALEIQPDHGQGLFERGNVLNALGRPEQALASFERALALEPGLVEALINRGNALSDLGRYAEALASCERALALRPDYVDALCNRGNALNNLKRYAEALASYERALEFKPDSALVHFNRGNTLNALERPEQALASYERALEIEPRYFEALINRGNALIELRRFEEALASYERALEVDPGSAAAHYDRGNALRALRRNAEALASYDRALALKPDYAEAFNNRAVALSELQRHAEAVADCDRAIVLMPDNAEVHYNRGNALHALNRHAEALASFDRAIELRPDYAEAVNNRGNALCGLGRHRDAVTSYERALEIRPNAAVYHSNKIFSLDFLPGHGFAEQRAVREDYERMHARDLLQPAPPRRERGGKRLPLTLGYVSADFRAHSAATAFGAVLRRHDRSKFKLVLYSSVQVEDPMTHEFRRIAHEWVEAAAMSDAELAERIRQDAIDILIDLSGHSAGNRLLAFARKPAPLQVSAWGHATGTGLATMDYLFADPVLVPAAVRHLFAEKIYDLPCFLPYEPPSYLPALASSPAARNGYVTFGCLNRFRKVSERALALWARILLAVPRSKLLLKDHALVGAESRDWALATIAAHGIGAERVELRGGTTHKEHLAAYNDVDLALDPFPYGGGITTFEAVTMGVPVVSMLGDNVPARTCGAIMAALGFADFAAEDEDGYFDVAVAKASDPAALAKFRRESRKRIAASPAGNPDLYVRAVERAYLDMWQSLDLEKPVKG